MCEGNDGATNDYEQAAYQGCGAGRCMKNEKRDELGSDEEEHDIDSEESAKVPRRRINDIAISKENQSTGDKEHRAGSCCGCPHAASNKCVAPGLQQSSRKQYQECDG